MTVDEFNNQQEAFSGEEEISYIINNEGDRPYYLIVFKAGLESDTTRPDYSWSSGFLVGFGCDTLVRRVEDSMVITSLNVDLEKDNTFTIFLKDEKGRLFINTELKGESQFEVFSLTGRRMYTSTITDKTTYFSLNQPLNRGIYVARLTLLDGHVISRRFMVR